MTIEVRVPTLGESVTEATVATWFKKPGDSVSIDEMLCELETDKVTVEVPSPVTGRLQEIIVKEGQTVSVDALLATLSKEENPKPQIDKDKIDQEPSKEKLKLIDKDIENAPSAKKLMQEKNLDPDKIIGTGRDGRIMKEDVQNLPLLSDSTNNIETKKNDEHEPSSSNNIKQAKGSTKYRSNFDYLQ